MKWRAQFWVGLGLSCAACGESAPPPRPAASAEPAAPPRPIDSLLLSAPGGVEVWFTDSRTDADSAGTSCVERVLEIRRDGRRIPVPLLYTGSAPRLVNDSTIEAPIWLHCRAGNIYQVSLVSGHPVRVR